jgi:hypothetical protein
MGLDYRLFINLSSYIYSSRLIIQQFQIQKVANNTDTSIKIGVELPRKPKL